MATVTAGGTIITSVPASSRSSRRSSGSEAIAIIAIGAGISPGEHHSREVTLAIKRIPIHSKITGSRGLNEDWWTLIIDSETGNRSVEHRWSYVQTCDQDQPSSGDKTVSVVDFLASDVDVIAHDKLWDLLRKGV
jgi:hypothetical protein